MHIHIIFIRTISLKPQQAQRTPLQVDDKPPGKLRRVVRKIIHVWGVAQVLHELVLGTVESQLVERREVLRQSVVHVESHRFNLYECGMIDVLHIEK